MSDMTGLLGKGWFRSWPVVSGESEPFGFAGQSTSLSAADLADRQPSHDSRDQRRQHVAHRASAAASASLTSPFGRPASAPAGSPGSGRPSTRAGPTPGSTRRRRPVAGAADRARLPGRTRPTSRAARPAAYRRNTSSANGDDGANFVSAMTRSGFDGRAARTCRSAAACAGGPTGRPGCAGTRRRCAGRSGR